MIPGLWNSVVRTLLIWSVLAGLAAAQGEVRINSQLKPGVLKLGGRATLTVYVEGSTQAELVGLPEVEGLKVGKVYGPDRRQQMSIVNGRRSSRVTTSWTVELFSERLGTYEIPGATVRVGGSEYLTPPRELQVVEDLVGSELGLLEIRGPEGDPVDGQPFRVEVTFGWVDAARASVNYANLMLPWWDSLQGAIVDEVPPKPGVSQVELNLNRRQRISVEQLDGLVRDGQRYRGFRFAMDVTPVRVGELVFPSNFLEFGQERQSSSFFSTSSQLVEQYFVSAEDLVVNVRALPKDGQPFDFVDAIGQFEMRATPSSRDLTVGDTLKLTVDLVGTGNLEFLTPPEPDADGAFGGFRYFGFVEEKLPGRRRLIYDLVPIDEDLSEIPSLELSYFDPVESAYSRAGTDPIPVRVRAMAGAMPLEGEERARFAEDIEDVPASALLPDGEGQGAPHESTLAAALGGLALTWFALRTAMRQGGADPGNAIDRRRRKALAHLERELRTSLEPERDLGAWNEFLAARTKEPAEAWFGRDSIRWAEGPQGARLSDASVATLTRISHDLESAAYGERENRVEREELLASAKELLEDGL